MARKQLHLAANTWTDLTTFIADVGHVLTIQTDHSDVQVGLRANAPTTGIALIPGEAMGVQIKHGDTLKLWARSVAGGKIEIDASGPRRVIVDGTGVS
jgi:hypothetical protein